MIDWNRVRELRDEIGAEDFEEVVALFLEETDTDIAALRADTEAAGVGARLHALKGSALNLGFAALAGLCQTGESAAALGATVTIDRDAILRCYAASKAAFLAALPGIAAR